MKDNNRRDKNIENKKTESLQQNTEDSTGQFLTTNQGLKINDDQNSLKPVNVAQPSGRFYSSGKDNTF